MDQPSKQPDGAVEWGTVPNVAARYKVAPATLRKWIAAMSAPEKARLIRTLGRIVRINVNEFDTWLANRGGA